MIRLAYIKVIKENSNFDGSYVYEKKMCLGCESIWVDHYQKDDTFFGQMVTTNDWSTPETHKEGCPVPKIKKIIENSEGP